MSDDMTGSDITIGEIARRLDTLDRQMGQGFARIDRHLEGLQFVPRGTYDAEKSAMTAEILDLKDKIKWISRTVAGALITAVIAAFAAAAAGGIL